MSVATTRRRIGVMGGTFDPIHVGHLIVASEALRALNLTEVLFVPAASPWHKHPEEDAQHRFAMVERAIEEEPAFRVSDVDIARGGNTYSVDTLDDLHRLEPEAEYFLLIGTDSLNSLHTWKHFKRLFALAHIVCLARPGYEPEANETLLSGVTFLPVPAIDVSSTECRDRLRYGRPVRYMVTQPVLEYIDEHQLYRRSA